MKTGCNTCKNSDKCEYKKTPFARDILSRGHGRCSGYEAAKKRKRT